MLNPIDRQTESELAAGIDSDELDRHLEAFAGLERTAGSDDDWEASRYVTETLEEYGVDATLYEHEGYVSVPESAGVTVTTPTRREFEAITVSFGASTPAAGVHGEIIHVESFDDRNPRTDLDGKIAYVPGTPKPSVVTRAERAGVAGVIFRSPNEHRYQGIVTPVWGTPSTDTADDVPDVPVVEVNRPDGEWLEDRLGHGPVEATLEASVTTELRSLPCPVGTIDGAESDRYLLVGNHVDSWFEGITDNATAMAATLEIARIVAARDEPLRRGLVFGFWSAHSTGRYAGSAWYADTNWLDLRDNCVVYLHIDLPGLQGADSVWYQHMAELEDEHLDAVRNATELSLRDPEDTYLGSTGRPARNSDQSFWGAGASSLLSGARLDAGEGEGGPIGGGWWWHTPADTRDKADLDVLVEETKLYLALVGRICNSPALPHDFTATVDDIGDALDAIESGADGAVNFDDLGQRLDRLRDRIARANAIMDDRAETDHTVRTDAEDLQVTLGNVLNPALYMEVPEYEHEPRKPYQQLPYLRIGEALPSLSGRERRFAETKLQRGRVKLAHRLRRATRTADEFLETHE